MSQIGQKLIFPIFKMQYGPDFLSVHFIEKTARKSLITSTMFWILPINRHLHYDEVVKGRGTRAPAVLKCCVNLLIL